jgi:RNA polymerase sigma factor (sigma-70 family)
MPEGGIPHVEPGLPAALASLSENQRVAVILVAGFGWRLREVAELRGVSISTVQNHLERGMKKLRTSMGEPS